VYAVARLARRQSLLWGLLDERGEYRLSIASATESFENVTPAGKAMIGMLGVFAQLESDMCSERTRDAMAHLKKQGFRFGMKPIAESAPELCRKVQQLYATGNYTHVSLAEHLNKSCVPTATGRGRWHSRTVRQALLANI
jgi:DNA invertase Pin-like site-specific DNA recombinase